MTSEIPDLDLIADMATRRMSASRWVTEEWDDDRQAALEGILIAARTWDPDGGCTWRTWAYGNAIHHIRHDRGVRRGSSYRAAVARRRFFRSPLSINALVADDGDRGVALADWLEAPPLITEPPLVDHALLDGVLGSLTDRERTMVTRTAREAAAELGIQRSSVLRARVRLYARLRSQLAEAAA